MPAVLPLGRYGICSLGAAECPRNHLQMWFIWVYFTTFGAKWQTLSSLSLDFGYIPLDASTDIADRTNEVSICPECMVAPYILSQIWLMEFPYVICRVTFERFDEV